MKKKRPSRAPEDGPAPGHLSDTDLSALSTFCDRVHLEDMPFESWEKSLSHLDLRVPLFLPASAVALGGERQVSFSRTTRDRPEDRPVRVPVSCVVKIPQGATHGLEIRLKGQGDVLAGQAGDLIVTLHLKP